MRTMVMVIGTTVVITAINMDISTMAIALEATVVVTSIMVGEDMMIRFGGVAAGQACTVVLRGSIYDRPALDRLLSNARAQVAKWNAEAAR